MTYNMYWLPFMIEGEFSLILSYKMSIEKIIDQEKVELDVVDYFLHVFVKLVPRD